MGLLVDIQSRLGGHGPLSTIAVIIAALAVYILGKFLRNIYLHPLSAYPGPKLAAATRLWYCYHTVRGNLSEALHEAHQRYGDVIRVAPTELSYTDPRAWDDIYGHRVGKGELIKDPLFYASLSSGGESIITASQARHGPLRKQASHGFSEKALRSREHVVQEYADLMLQRLDEAAAGGEASSKVNIVDWYNFFTFDVMGDMVFGQSFNCLSSLGYHPWVRLIFDSVKAGAFARCVTYWAPLRPYAKWLMPPEIRRRRVEQRRMAIEKATYRKTIKDGRQDLISGYLVPESGVSNLEYQSTVETLIIAGSETTATLMSGLTYYILRDKSRLAKLQHEIRTTFERIEDINFVTVNKLPYLLACLDEALRIYPPVRDSFPRNTGPSEQVLCGKVVPAWTTVGVNHWSASHSPRNFSRPDEFIPERYLAGHKGFESDRFEASQPFHIGARNCLGRNLAFFEMRILLAKLFWRFDLELDLASAQWNQQKAYLLWEKPAMFVKVLPRIL